MSERYKLDDSSETWWCNSHNRYATWLDTQTNKHICDPRLSGIMLPCFTVNTEHLVHWCPCLPRRNIETQN